MSNTPRPLSEHDRRCLLSYLHGLPNAPPMPSMSSGSQGSSMSMSISNGSSIYTPSESCSFTTPPPTPLEPYATASGPGIAQIEQRIPPTPLTHRRNWSPSSSGAWTFNFNATPSRSNRSGDETPLSPKSKPGFKREAGYHLPAFLQKRVKDVPDETADWPNEPSGQCDADDEMTPTQALFTRQEYYSGGNYFLRNPAMPEKRQSRREKPKGTCWPPELVSPLPKPEDVEEGRMYGGFDEGGGYDGGLGSWQAGRRNGSGFVGVETVDMYCRR